MPPSFAPPASEGDPALPPRHGFAAASFDPGAAATGASFAFGPNVLIAQKLIVEKAATLTKGFVVIDAVGSADLGAASAFGVYRDSDKALIGKTGAIAASLTSGGLKEWALAAEAGQNLDVQVADLIWAAFVVPTGTTAPTFVTAARMGTPDAVNRTGQRAGYSTPAAGLPATLPALTSDGAIWFGAVI